MLSDVDVNAKPAFAAAMERARMKNCEIDNKIQNLKDSNTGL